MSEPASTNLTPAELRELFVICAQLVSFDALRMKPREKQFLLMLGGDSWAEGRADGLIGIALPVQGRRQSGRWLTRLSEWRPAEIFEMLDTWRRAGWTAVDEAEGRFRLAPDRLPGWADAFRLWQEAQREMQPLNLTTEHDLHKELAGLSQATATATAGEIAKFSQSPKSPIKPGQRGANTGIAKFSQSLGGTGVPVEGTENETFIRLNVKRLNVSRSDPSTELPRAREDQIAKISQSPTDRLKERVRAFVGEADWQSRSFWNAGRGWQDRLFTEEGRALTGALDYLEAGLKSGEAHVRKSRGAMLWNEFQRLRHAGKAR